MDDLRSMRPLELAGLFGVPTALNTLACRLAIPTVDGWDVLPIEVTYFLCVGLLVLVPMFAWALYLSGREVGSFRAKEIFKRMRVHRIKGQEWLWTVSTFVVLVASSFVIAKILMPSFGLDATPFFFENMPLAPENMWILAVWPAFFFFNIFGEEFLWRGYIQPRQETTHREVDLARSRSSLGHLASADGARSDPCVPSDLLHPSGRGPTHA